MTSPSTRGPGGKRSFKEKKLKKNPAELPASRPNSGAGTEKRPLLML
jgi:hypothetical protein